MNKSLTVIVVTFKNVKSNGEFCSTFISLIEIVEHKKHKFPSYIHYQRKQKIGEWNYFTVFYINNVKITRSRRVILDVKLLLSNQMSSSCCLAIFGDVFFRIV